MCVAGLLLCVDLTAKVVHQQNVFQMMRQIWTGFDRSQMDVRRVFGRSCFVVFVWALLLLVCVFYCRVRTVQAFQAEVMKKVVGTIVLTRYVNVRARTAEMK